MRFFYRPAYRYFFVDIIILLLSIYIVLDWFPLTAESPFRKYSVALLAYGFAWATFSYLFKRYLPFRKQQYFAASLKLFYTSGVIFGIFAILLHLYFRSYSGYVLLTITAGVFLINYIFISLYYAYRMAVDYNDVTLKVCERINARVVPVDSIDDESYTRLCSIIKSHSGKDALKYLGKQVDLRSGNTLVFLRNDAENLQMMPRYRYSAMIQLERLNNMQGINAKLAVINEKLPDNGIFVCCFESKSTRKKRFLKKYPRVLNYIIYSLDYVYKRVMPKIFITRKLYYIITRGNNRILSKTEVLGRLYCYGFRVNAEKKVGKLTYIVAQRVKQPERIQKRTYGPLIRLRRFGKKGIPFEVYKMRTMHPYAEYLQSYIYERNSLKNGGKFNKDIRVTTMGRFVRKYWLDELPMVMNVLKGDMKLVGVRPLSAQYFSLYSKELQEKRNDFRPGLLPPFYADMPKTLEEIQLSEMKYLTLCETKGELRTDIIYLLRIMKNIIFKKARSG